MHIFTDLICIALIEVMCKWNVTTKSISILYYIIDVIVNIIFKINTW